MSIVVCDHCDAYVDSDFDGDCFIENPYDANDVTTLCERCREKAWDRQNADVMENGPGPSLLDQQIAAMKFK